MAYDIKNIDEPLSNISWGDDIITCSQKNCKQVIKALKLYDNLQSHILILLEEISHSSSSQLRFLLEELIKVRDE